MSDLRGQPVGSGPAYSKSKPGRVIQIYWKLKRLRMAMDTVASMAFDTVPLASFQDFCFCAFAIFTHSDKNINVAIKTNGRVYTILEKY